MESILSKNPLVDRLSFKSKLDALLEVIEHKFVDDKDFVKRFRGWHKDANRVRARRNSFLHGRWGISPMAGVVVNVAPGLPGNEPQREDRYSIDQLQQELVSLRVVTIALHELTSKWPAVRRRAPQGPTCNDALKDYVKHQGLERTLRKLIREELRRVA